MRTLFINRMLSMCRGGGETFDLEISRHLVQMGCDISYLSGIPLFSSAQLARPEVGSRRSEDGCRNSDLGSPTSDFRPPTSWHTIRTPYFGWFPWDKVRGGWRLRLFDFKCFEYVAAKWCMKHEDDYDIIQVCELPFFVNYYKKMGGRLPVVIRCTAPNYDDPVGGLQQADAVIASGMSIEHIKKEDREDVYEISNSVDPALFFPADSLFREELNISSDTFMFLYVARFQGFKNHPLLVKAFAQYREQGGNGVLVFVGSGPHEDAVKKQCVALGVSASVVFLGEVKFELLPSVYNASDVHVISSDYESFCFSAIEAMACGKPVISTDNGWVPVLIGDQGAEGRGMKDEVELNIRGMKDEVELNIRGMKDEVELELGGKGSQLSGGLVVPVGDVEAFCNALKWMVANKEKGKEMGLRNLAYVKERYTWDINAGKLLEVYCELEGRV